MHHRLKHLIGLAQRKSQHVLTCMARQFPADPDVPLPSLQAVDGADVVEAAACDVVPGGGVCTGHHPGRAQRDGMYLGRKKCSEATDI